MVDDRICSLRSERCGCAASEKRYIEDMWVENVFKNKSYSETDQLPFRSTPFVFALTSLFVQNNS